MNEAEKLSHELKESKMLCAACPDCKKTPEINYIPGSTTIKCACRSITLPDWCPRIAQKIWNRCYINKSFSQKTINHLIQKELFNE